MFCRAAAPEREREPRRAQQTLILIFIFITSVSSDLQWSSVELMENKCGGSGGPTCGTTLSFYLEMLAANAANLDQNQI